MSYAAFFTLTPLCGPYWLLATPILTSTTYMRTLFFELSFLYAIFS